LTVRPSLSVRATRSRSRTSPPTTLDLWEGVDPADYLASDFITGSGLSSGNWWYGPTDPAGSASNGDLWLDTFVFNFDPESNAWPAITEVPVTNATNTYTRSIVTPSIDLNSTATTRQARIAWTSGTEVDDRRIHTFDACGTLDDVEVTALLYGRQSPQQGIALRINNIGNTTTQNMYTVWNDAISGIAPFFNVGNWKGIDGSFTHTEPVSDYVELLEDTFDIISMTRASNVVTAVLEPTHDYRVGQTIAVIADTTTSFNTTSATFTAVNAASGLVTVTWNQTAANESAVAFGRAGRGGFPGGSHVYPHWIKVNLKGTTVRAKFWRQGQAEPSWADSRSTFVLRDTTPVGPTGSGKSDSSIRTATRRVLTPIGVR
jgi:hypothetical protein